MVVAAEISEEPWASLALKRGLAIELDHKTCQANQLQRIVAQIDRRDSRFQLHFSFKFHTRRVHDAADQRTLHLQMGAEQDIVESSPFEGRSSGCLHMHIAEIEVALPEHQGDESFNLGFLGFLAIPNAEPFRLYLARG